MKSVLYIKRYLATADKFEAMYYKFEAMYYKFEALYYKFKPESVPVNMPTNTLCNLMQSSFWSHYSE